MTSVVLVDDQRLVRDGLRLILELAGIDVVGEASDGEQAVELVLSAEPDVVLMDVRMPRMDGIEATRQLVAAGTLARVLVLTTFDDEEYAYEALRAGACGFLLKDAGGQRLVDAVAAAAAGEMPLAPTVVSRMVAQYVGAPRRTDGPDVRLRPLSPRELEVLSLIGAGLSNNEIADRLVISVATAKSHVRHILAKLDLRDRPQAVVLAHECRVAAGSCVAGLSAYEEAAE